MKNSFVYISIITLIMLSCNSEQKKGEHVGHDTTQKDADIKYTCPMHPSVIKDSPGQCPICGMDLVVKTQTTGNNNELLLSESQIKLANVTTQRVSMKSIGQSVAITAKIVVDESKSEVISSRAAGRIEKLFFKETGRTVKKGEPLYELYSENLLTLQREYLLAKEQYETIGKNEAKYQSFFKGAERKLLLYGLSKAQVDKLAQTKLVQDRIAFLAPVSGIITEVYASEGQYIGEGTMLYRIEDIEKLWIESELYPGETKLVKLGDKVSVEISGYENKRLESVVTFLSPEYRANSQITLMRLSLSNPTLEFKPGMQAQVFFTHSAKTTIAIPTDAVIRSGKGTHVYVVTNKNTFQPRMVTTGLEDFEQVEITEGLTENDSVVISGAYLLYSELVLKRGGNPMAGHQHEGMKNDNSGDEKMQKETTQLRTTTSNEKNETVDPKFSIQIANLLTPYLKLKDALVASDAKAANLESKNFTSSLMNVDMTLLQGKAHVTWMEKFNAMKKNSADIQAVSDLKKQRSQFSELTNTLYSSFKIYTVNGLAAYYQFCPMAFDNKGAYWISREEEIRNPYFGEQMLRCGETKENLK